MAKVKYRVIVTKTRFGFDDAYLYDGRSNLVNVLKGSIVMATIHYEILDKYKYSKN
jgi:hypothetical protein